MGAVPAKSRRADARDGDQRRARLHVPGLQRRFPHAHQSGHPAAPGPVDGQQPAPHRAAEQPAVLISRNAGPLLRRRNRHGRQHLPRRSQRRAHAHAMERGPQRRLLARHARQAVQPGDHGPDLGLRGRQRGGAAGRSLVAAELDAQHDRAAQTVSRVRPRHAGISESVQSQSAGVSAAR